MILLCLLVSCVLARPACDIAVSAMYRIERGLGDYRLAMSVVAWGLSIDGKEVRASSPATVVYDTAPRVVLPPSWLTAVPVATAYAGCRSTLVTGVRVGDDVSTPTITWGTLAQMMGDFTWNLQRDTIAHADHEPTARGYADGVSGRFDVRIGNERLTGLIESSIAGVGLPVRLGAFCGALHLQPSLVIDVCANRLVCRGRQSACVPQVRLSRGAIGCAKRHLSHRCMHMIFLMWCLSVWTHSQLTATFTPAY
jgi:hypothetical protein